MPGLRTRARPWPVSLMTGQPHTRRSDRHVAWALAIVATAAVAGCAAGGSGLDADAGLAGGDAAACEPASCSSARADCGTIPDGCSGTVDCGVCQAPATCGGGGLSNICGCQPLACIDESADCGVVPDGCGGTIDCGTCTGPESCGGGGVPNRCGEGTCTPTSCSAAGAECGTIADGCGGTLDCGVCCVADVGDSCDASYWEEAPGCQDDYGCASFWGVYYNSPSGCDPATAGSFVEYTGPSCTYVGFAYYDPFHNTPDGTCIDSTARGYSIPDTYTRVVPGDGCTHSQWISITGTIQCSGVCSP